MRRRWYHGVDLCPRESTGSWTYLIVERQNAECCTIYVVDDEPTLAETLVRALDRAGHTVTAFNRADDALAAVVSEPPDLVLADIRMPGHDGLWLLDQVRAEFPDVGVLMMTAMDDVRLAVQCMKQGALDYLTKPFTLDGMAVAITKASQRQRLIRENREHRILLEARTAELHEALESVNEMFHSSMGMLIRALDWRERETKNHSCRVARYAQTIGSRLNLGNQELRQLLVGGLLHDIGKIGVSDSILLKPGPLTDQEWLLMRRHPEIGYDILTRTSFLEDAGDVVLYHHERFEGGGYPRNLKGKEIPLTARIFSAADTLDAMTNDRPYRPALSFEAATGEISQCSGSQFDPEVVAAFCSVPEEEWDYLRALVDEEVWRLLDVALVGRPVSRVSGDSVGSKAPASEDDGAPCAAPEKPPEEEIGRRD